MAAQTGATNIVQLPLAFVRSGVIYPNYGTAGYVGSVGFDWSRTAQSSTYAYYLRYDATTVNPSTAGDRWNGFSLRCLYQAKA